MTYNVFGGTLNLAQSISVTFSVQCYDIHVSLATTSQLIACICLDIVHWKYDEY